MAKTKAKTVDITPSEHVEDLRWLRCNSNALDAPKWKKMAPNGYTFEHWSGMMTHRRSFRFGSAAHLFAKKIRTARKRRDK